MESYIVNGHDLSHIHYSKEGYEYLREQLSEMERDRAQFLKQGGSKNGDTYKRMTSYIEDMRGRLKAVQDYLIEKGIMKRYPIDAYWDAVGRFHGMTKLKKTMAKVSGQWKKLEKMRRKINIDNTEAENKKQIAEFDKMFKTR